MEGAPPREHLVEAGAEREDVGPAVDGLALHLLGGHVARRSDDDVALRLEVRGPAFPLEGGVGREELGEAEVEHLHVPVRREEDVLGLQVAVDESLLVRGAEPARDLHRDLDRGGDVEVDQVADVAVADEREHGRVTSGERREDLAVHLEAVRRRGAQVRRRLVHLAPAVLQAEAAAEGDARREVAEPGAVAARRVVVGDAVVVELAVAELAGAGGRVVGAAAAAVVETAAQPAQAREQPGPRDRGCGLM